MSWTSYVDNLMATKHMTAVGIFGLDGSPWATSSGFPLNNVHVKTIVDGVANSDKIATNGLQVTPTDRYVFVRADPGISIMLKKGQSGIVASKTNQCILVGLHDEKVKAEAVLVDLGKVTDYLAKCGY